MEDDDTLVDDEEDFKGDVDDLTDGEDDWTDPSNEDDDMMFIRNPLSANEVSDVFPSKFTPPRPTDQPNELFHYNITTMGKLRFLRRTNERECLMYTSGACLNDDHRSAKAGCGFVYRPGLYKHLNIPALAMHGRLESRGPEGELYLQTKTRAELRAVVALLRFRTWEYEGFRRLVVATDSDYVVRGATERLQDWVDSGWRVARNLPFPNRDLWEMLLREIRKLLQFGVAVVFWKIERHWNLEADAFARKGARLEEVPHFGRRLKECFGKGFKRDGEF